MCSRAASCGWCLALCPLVVTHRQPDRYAAALQFDPTLQMSQGPLGSLVTFLASAVLVGADLHLQVLVALADSFYVVPAGADVDLMNASVVWIELAGVVIQTGARIAAPAVVLVFVINLFVAVITRLSPQMNIFFSLGMLLTLWAGMIVYFAGMLLIFQFHLVEVREAIALIPEILQRLGRRWQRTKDRTRPTTPPANASRTSWNGTGTEVAGGRQPLG